MGDQGVAEVDVRESSGRVNASAFHSQKAKAGLVISSAITDCVSKTGQRLLGQLSMHPLTIGASCHSQNSGSGTAQLEYRHRQS